MKRVATLCYLIALAGFSALAQEPLKPPPALAATPAMDPKLSELDSTKYELLNAKYGALQKDYELLLERFKQTEQMQEIVRQQRALVLELNVLARQVLSARGLRPEEFSVNWQSKAVEAVPKPAAAAK